MRRRLRIPLVNFHSSVMTSTPEARARALIDAQLVAAGWVVQDRAALNRSASLGVAVRE